MTRRHFPKIVSTRHGFTLIELLVAISIIAVLASLIAPAIQSARRSARRIECLNNMRNVGLGILSFSSTNGGKLPTLSSAITVTNSSGEGTMMIGWPISILPALDNSALLRNINSNALISSGAAAMSTTENVWIPTFTCPDDVASFRQAGGLSYVVNAGFLSSEVWGNTETSTFLHQPYLINWKGKTNPAPFRSTDGTSATGEPSPLDRQVALSTGVFWRLVGDGGVAEYFPSVDFVSLGDGTTTTLMVTENMNAGAWSSTNVNAIGFGILIPVDPANQAPLVGTNSPCGEFTSTMSLDTDFACSTIETASSASFINRSATTSSTTIASTGSTSSLVSSAGCGLDGGGTTVTSATTGNVPRPSSQHVGGVNVIMVDGSGRFLSETVNPHVYARLVTSNGASYSERTLNQSAY